MLLSLLLSAAIITVVVVAVIVMADAVAKPCCCCHHHHCRHCRYWCRRLYRRRRRRRVHRFPEIVYFDVRMIVLLRWPPPGVILPTTELWHVPESTREPQKFPKFPFFEEQQQKRRNKIYCCYSKGEWCLALTYRQQTLSTKLNNPKINRHWHDYLEEERVLLIF